MVLSCTKALDKKLISGRQTSALACNSKQTPKENEMCVLPREGAKLIQLPSDTSQAPFHYTDLQSIFHQ